VGLSDDELIVSADDTPPTAGASKDRSWRFYNIIILGLSFMLLFTAFQTGSMVEVSKSMFINFVP